MKKCKSGCDLKSCFLCTMCIPDWLPAIDANRQNFLYNKGEVIFKEGDPVQGIFFLYSGLVKIHKQWGSDRELIVHFVRKGEILGHRGLGKNLIYPVSATALEPITVCYLPLSFFKSTLKVNNELLFQLMVNCFDELEESEKKMRDLVHLPVKSRVAQAIFTLKEKFGYNEEGFIDIALSRHDLASFAGTTYETAFRTLNEFINDDLIEMSNKKIRIKNEKELLTPIMNAH
ncbi:Crp/Fnr family transcriptional regulator [Chitinophagaceae bacterium LB-8]|uniref:Crp/Fnr family transcriptional regulator n=1 Tax=Paraflavisolibacter caeni TaxID=2982496 RepID=A0A9X2XWX6_9BACT|nr:Crp/Fnr family transcriptional regulator [Paraflavisolibacter caeni]MCU7550766.1 Crp/Fnr family transcriptional regulator [Paraflavisolibacter caeni]